MISLIIGTNRPGGSTHKVATHIGEFYRELRVPLRVLDLEKLPPEIFLPASYARKPESFQPFADAVLNPPVCTSSCRNTTAACPAR